MARKPTNYGAQNRAPTENLQERFDDSYHADPISGCWNWTKAPGSNGYGRLRVADRMLSAHRVSWELHIGPVPEGEGYHGTCVLHRCDNRACVNPAHLFLGTTADNMADKRTKGRQARGDHNGRAKLAADQILELRDRRGQLQRELAEEFGISQGQVSDIRSGKRWAHLKEAA